MINGTDPLIWSAFRESSFGVAKLVLLNDTTATYTWTRYACDSGSGVYFAEPLGGINQSEPSLSATAANNWRMNFSSSCVTRYDNSAQAMELVDEAIITNTFPTCASRRRLTETKELAGFKKTDRVNKVLHKAELKHEVEFREASVKGESYIRPYGALPRMETKPKKLSLDDSCGASSQIHVTIGDNPHHSIILSFASAIGPASGMDINSHFLEVAYGISPTNLNMIAVSDHPQSYASLLVVSKKTLEPGIGKPNLNFTALRPYIDTTSWYAATALD